MKNAPPLPRFIIGDDGNPDEDEARDFVVHCETPRFVLEILPDGEGATTFLESESDFIAIELANGREPASTIARLMREAHEFYLDAIADY